MCIDLAHITFFSEIISTQFSLTRNDGIIIALTEHFIGSAHETCCLSYLLRLFELNFAKTYSRRGLVGSVLAY